MARSRLVMRSALPGGTPARRPSRCSRAHHPMGIARGKPLLLPDRDVPLDALDAVPAGLEGLGPVGRGAAHHDRGLTHLEAAGSVEDRELQYRPPFAHLIP